MPVTLVDAYCTLAALKLEKGIPDTADDDVLSTAINAASRQIDGYCGRRFWQDANVVAREYFPDSPTVVYTDDISTATGLIVKIDFDLDGTFEQTLTVNADFVLHPRNAQLEFPVEPYTELQIVPVGTNAFFPQPRYGRASVQVTAKYGWPAVPDDVTKACLIQAQMLASANQAAFGIASLTTIDGAGMRASAWNPLARVLLDRYQKPAVG